jgi:glyoxylase-like metal-dependent hydrolase (beta-lactamase superfamily II)
LNGRDAVLVDSGLDDDTGRRVLKVLGEYGIKPFAIVNTHSHADHCGANSYLKEKAGVVIYAPEIEADLIQHPILEPLAFFSFASPLGEMKNKFMMARPSRVDHVISNDESKLALGGIELGVIRLPGHSINQIGLEYDGVLFCADSILSKELLAKHKLPVNYDLERQRETLRFLERTRYRNYVPSHAPPSSEISELVRANMEAIDHIENVIIGFLEKPMTTDDITRGVCGILGLGVRSPTQYFLTRSVVMAFLSALCGRSAIKPVIVENELLWERLTRTS